MAGRVPISQELRARLAEKARAGTGGFQALAQKILDHVSDGTLDLSDTLREQIEHYAFDFGRGGWQLLLRDLMAEIEAAEPRA